MGSDEKASYTEEQWMKRTTKDRTFFAGTNEIFKFPRYRSKQFHYLPTILRQILSMYLIRLLYAGADQPLENNLCENFVQSLPTRALCKVPQRE